MTPMLLARLTVSVLVGARSTVKAPATDGRLTCLAVFGDMADLLTSVTDMVLVATGRGWWGRWARGVGGESVSAVTTVEAEGEDGDIRAEPSAVAGGWRVLVRGVEGVRGVGVVESALVGVCGLGVG
jgi:hypothetical protein